MDETNSIPKNNIFKYLFVVTFIVFTIAIIFGYFILQSNKNEQKPQETTANIQEKKQIILPNSWSLPISTDKTIPIVKDGILYQYSITKKILQPTDYKTNWGSGASGFGGDSPLLSPNGKFIAFINESDNDKLYILSTGNQKATKITDYSIEYLTNWSSDSSKILYYTKLDDLEKRKQPEGMGNEEIVWETIESFVKNFAPGFHSFNVETGNDIFLYPISSTDGFINSNQILVEMLQNGQNGKNRFVLFNVDTFEADYSTVNYIIKAYSTQMSFSSDGKYWATNFDQGNYDGTRLIYAKFPDLEGDIIETSPWANVQFPILSPNGKYLAYLKKDSQIKEGQFAGMYSNKTMIWDISLKKIIAESSGSPQYWLDEDTILIARHESDYGTNINAKSLDLFNVKTNNKESFSIK